jgi:Rrf2 family transcriptional regulator, iron-sulfur cluster assembly transcription factor
MFSKSCQYAIRAVLYLAEHASEGHCVGVKEIAEALKVPGPFLAKLLQQLSRNNLIGSTKGPHGGFCMTPKHLEAPLLHIIECIDGPEVFNSCVLGLPECSGANPCPLHSQALVYKQGLLKILKEKNLLEVVQQIPGIV